MRVAASPGNPVAFALAAAVLSLAPLAPPVAGGEVPETALELHRRALDDDTAWELLASLTTEVGPRLAGSEGDRRAVAWGLREMERLGFANVRAEEVEVPRWVRGEASARILSPFPQPLVLTALGGSVGTPEEGVVAEILRVETVEDLEGHAEEAVRGKIVFFDDAMERTRTGEGYGETAAIRTRGPAAAAAKGAVAAIIRSVGTGTHRFPHTGGTSYGDGPRIPAAALAIPDADLLARQVATGEPVRLELFLSARDLGPAKSANVVGEVTGRDDPGEIVLLACHLDSWDLGTGAIDDGAGCATVLGAAKLVSDLPPQRRPARTLRVVLFANEEFGLSGAFAYAERHAEEIDRHYAATEADFGAGRVWAGGSRVAPQATAFIETFSALLAELGLEHLGNDSGGGADLIPLVRQGVPVVDLFEDGTDYFDYHHTADDTLDKVDARALAFNVGAHAAMAWIAAESEARLRPAPAAGER